MKLKKVFSSIVALIMCLPLIPSLKSAQTAYAEIMGSYISWQEAYYRALLNFQSTNTYKSKENYGIQCSKYDLYDIDQNGTPELIISEGEFHTAECIVYTFYNSQLIKLNTFNMTYGVLHVNPDNNYLIFRDSHMLNDTTICYTLSNGQLNQKINLHKADDGSVTIDNITVSKSKYDSEIGKYYNSSIMQIGRKNDFGYFAFYENYKATTTTTTKRTTTTTKTTTTTTRKTTTTTRRTTTTTQSTSRPEFTEVTTHVDTEINPVGEHLINHGMTYNFSTENVNNSKSKPYLVVDKKVITSLEEAQGQIVTVDFNLTGENVDKKYCSTGFHIYWDDRLTPVKERRGKYVVRKEALSSNSGSFEQAENNNGVFVSTSGPDDGDYHTGTMFSISFKLPDDAKNGDVYPIDVVYQYDINKGDLFTNSKDDADGQLMQAWFFTKGTFSSDNPSDDPYLVKSGVEFADGYIAVDFNGTTTTTTTTTTRRIITTMTTTKRTTTTTKPITTTTTTPTTTPTTTTTSTTTTTTTSTKQMITTTIPELSLNKTNITLANGDQYTIIPNRKDVTFKTNNSDVAVVSSQGVITAVGIGSATISVIDSESNVVQIKITVTSVITEESTTGDVNNDNIIDSRDASAVLREYAASSTETGGSFTNEQKKAADINGDNIIDSRDASLILMFYAQASTENGEQSIENFIKKFK